MRLCNVLLSNMANVITGEDLEAETQRESTVTAWSQMAICSQRESLGPVHPITTF